MRYFDFDRKDYKEGHGAEIRPVLGFGGFQVVLVAERSKLPQPPTRNPAQAFFGHPLPQSLTLSAFWGSVAGLSTCVATAQ